MSISGIGTPRVSIGRGVREQLRETTWERRGDPEKDRIQVGVGDAESAERRSRQLVESTDMVGRGLLEGRVKHTEQGDLLRSQLRGAEFGRLQREIDLARGKERGLEEFGEGKLGRVSARRSGESKDIISRRRQFADEGYGAQVLQAQREQGQIALQRNQMAQERSLAAQQAAGGVRGGLAAAQQMALQKQQQDQAQNLERDLMTRSAEFQAGQLGGLESSITRARSDELARQQYNLEQMRKEALGRLTMQFGEAGLGLAERGQAGSLEAARLAKEAGIAQAGRGGKK